MLTTISCFYVGFYLSSFHISKAKCVWADNSILSHILFFVRYMYHIYDKNLLKLYMAVTKDIINEFNTFIYQCTYLVCLAYKHHINIFLQHKIFVQDKFYLFSFDRNLMNISSCFRLSFLIAYIVAVFLP